MKRILLFTIVLFTFSLIVITSGVVLQATSGQVALAEVVETTKLAQLLETYGVPVGIASAISAAGTYGATMLITRGLRSSKNQMIAALQKVGLTAEDIAKLMTKLDLVEKKLEEMGSKSKKEAEDVYNLKVIPALEKIEELVAVLFDERKSQSETVKKLSLLLGGEEKPIDTENTEEV